MATKNDITGDKIKSKPLSDQGRENWDRIFKRPSPIKEPAKCPAKPE